MSADVSISRERWEEFAHRLAEMAKQVADRDREIYRLEGVVRSQVEALNHWRKQFDIEHGLRLVAQEKLEGKV